MFNYDEVVENQQSFIRKYRRVLKKFIYQEVDWLNFRANDKETAKKMFNALVKVGFDNAGYKDLNVWV